MSKEQTKKVSNPRRAVTGKVRFSYLNVFNPRGQYDDDGKEVEGSTKFYSACILVDKKDTKTIDRINKIIDAAIESGEAILKSKATGKVNKSSLDIAFRDGDLKAEDHPEFKGCMYFNCKTKIKPQVIDAEYVEIIDPAAIKSGDYGKASVSAYPYATKGKKGVAFNLNGLILLEEGEPLGNFVSVVDEFAEDEDDDDDLL